MKIFDEDEEGEIEKKKRVETARRLKEIEENEEEDDLFFFSSVQPSVKVKNSAYNITISTPKPISVTSTLHNITIKPVVSLSVESVSSSITIATTTTPVVTGTVPSATVPPVSVPVSVAVKSTVHTIGIKPRPVVKVPVKSTFHTIGIKPRPVVNVPVKSTVQTIGIKPVVNVPVKSTVSLIGIKVRPVVYVPVKSTVNTIGIRPVVSLNIPSTTSLIDIDTIKDTLTATPAAVTASNEEEQQEFEDQKGKVQNFLKQFESRLNYPVYDTLKFIIPNDNNRYNDVFVIQKFKFVKKLLENTSNQKEKKLYNELFNQMKQQLKFAFDESKSYNKFFNMTDEQFESQKLSHTLNIYPSSLEIIIPLNLLKDYDEDFTCMGFKCKVKGNIFVQIIFRPKNTTDKNKYKYIKYINIESEDDSKYFEASLTRSEAIAEMSDDDQCIIVITNFDKKFPVTVEYTTYSIY